MSFIGPDVIQDLRDMVADFMPDEVEIHRTVDVQGSGGTSTTDAIIGTTSCSIEIYPRPRTVENIGNRPEDEPLMQINFPIGVDIQIGDRLIQTRDIMGPIVDGPIYQVFSKPPPESFAVQDGAWLKVLEL